MTSDRNEPMPGLTRSVGDGDHTQGPASAPVTLVVYGDYQCPYTRKAYLSARRVLNQAGGTMRFVFRHYPLSHIHSNAQSAAEAAEAASAQGKFWEMSDRLFRHQRALERPQLGLYAADVGLDISRFDKEMAERTHAARVLEDFESGRQSGVRQTPTFFVNGVRYAGEYTAGTLLGVIEEARVSERGAEIRRRPGSEARTHLAKGQDNRHATRSRCAPTIRKRISGGRVPVSWRFSWGLFMMDGRDREELG